MFRSFLNLFRHPSIYQIQQTELYSARKSLIEAKLMAEFYASNADMLERRVQRLTADLASTAKDYPKEVCNS